MKGEFEMVIEEPVLQIEIANKFSSEAEFVESLANVSPLVDA